MQGSEIESIMRCVGPNKVIGKIDELPILLQSSTRYMEKSSQLPKIFCPFEYFKSMRNKKSEIRPLPPGKDYKDGKDGKDDKDYNDNNDRELERAQQDKENKENKENNKTSISISSHTDCIPKFMHKLDPMLSLCSSEIREKKMSQMKLELSLNLNNGKQFFKKMGFSRRKNLCASKMENELTQQKKEECLSHEVLEYLCKVCNMDAILIDPVGYERLQVQGCVDKNKDHDVAIILCDTGEKRRKVWLGEVRGGIDVLDVQLKQINRFVMSALVHKPIMSAAFLDSLKLHEIKRLYKMLTGDDSKNQGWKKESYVDIILGMKLKWDREENTREDAQ